MGVDYDANFGIGCFVTPDTTVTEEELEDGLIEYLCNAKISPGFKYIEVGGGAYSGVANDIAICVEDVSFEDYVDFSIVKRRLRDELERLRLKPTTEFGQVGGLHVW